MEDGASSDEDAEEDQESAEEKQEAEDGEESEQEDSAEDEEMEEDAPAEESDKVSSVALSWCAVAFSNYDGVIPLMCCLHCLPSFIGFMYLLAVRHKIHAVVRTRERRDCLNVGAIYE